MCCAQLSTDTCDSLASTRGCQGSLTCVLVPVTPSARFAVRSLLAVMNKRQGEVTGFKWFESSASDGIVSTLHSPSFLGVRVHSNFGRQMKILPVSGSILYLHRTDGPHPIS